MEGVQLELFYPSNTLEVRETPDLLPEETWLDRYWTMANHAAEVGMAWCRAFGFM